MHLVSRGRETEPWEQRCQGRAMESHWEVLPKQGMGSKLLFLRKKSSPFSILVKALPYPEG